jgi:hypothetical protein
MPPVPGFGPDWPRSNGDAPATPVDLRRLYEEAEAAVAQAMEKLVAHPSFGRLLAQVSENVIALNRIASDSADLALSNLRIAGRRDVVRLERLLGRTEDKLELVLQQLESVRDELVDPRRGPDRASDGNETVGEAAP